jgi:hypothetical protein
MQIEINNTKYKVSELVKQLRAFGKVGSFLKDNGIALQKVDRVALLRSLLDDKVAPIREAEGPASELRYRLGFYVLFSESQLQNFLFSLNDKNLEEEYLAKLFAIVSEKVDKKLVKEILSGKNAVLSVREVDQDMNKLFNIDNEHSFDRVSTDIVRPVLYHASLISEIREIGLKYGVKVPLRLGKSALIEQVMSYFPNQSEEEGNKLKHDLSSMHPILITRFAKDNNILVSQDLRKEEIIEYILRNSAAYGDIYIKPDSRKAYFFTEEQREVYGLLEVKTFEEEEQEASTVKTTVVETVETANEELEEEQQQVIVKEIIREVQKESDKAGNGLFFALMTILIILQLIALVLVIYFFLTR